MCTESKKQNKYLSGLKRAFAFALLAIAFVSVFSPMKGFAQLMPVKANVVVMPPYTPSLYDYINTPNKVLITLTHSLLDYPDVDVYLKGTIRSEGGILVTTEQGYKPSVPITLERGKTYKLNNENIQDAFNLRHTIIEGTNLTELLNGAGLPEDYYQICVQAFDFNTDQPLSGEQPIGCSNIFNITSLDAPQIIVPQCGDPISQSVIQQVNINWTIPPGTIPGSRYLFEMVEIPDHSTLNPKEAFETSAYPPLYSEETSVNSLILTIQKVILTPGYTYAFRIQAFDPSNKMHYRNGGLSEVCWFKYGAPPSSQALWDIKQVQFVTPTYCHPDSMLLASPPDGFYIGWRVLPFDPQNYKDPLENLPGHQFQVNFYAAKNAQQPVYTATTDRTFFQADPAVENLPFVSGKSYWVDVQVENGSSKEVIYTSERCAFRYVFSNLSGAGLVSRTVSGSLQYKFENQGLATYPVANSEIRLKCVYLLSDKNSAKQYEIPESDVAAGFGTSGSLTLGLTATPVASTLTAANGNFTFHFSWPESAPLGEIAANFSYNSKYFGSLSGKLMRAMRVEIVNPYYAQPQSAVMDNQTPHDMGEVQTYVYTYELKASLTKGYKNNSKVKEELTGKNVYIFRKQKLPGIPVNEGDRLGTYSMMVMPTELKTAGYYLVASGKAEVKINDKGESVALVTFPRLIENLVNGDEYYWYVEGSGLGAAQPLSFSDNMSSNVAFTNVSVQTGALMQQSGSSGGAGNQQYTVGNQQYFFLNSSQTANNGYEMQGTQYLNTTGFKTGSGTQSGSSQIGGSSYTLQTGAMANMPGVVTLESSNISITKTGNYSFKVEADLKAITSDPPMSGIKGRLVYEFPGKPGNARPLANRKISIISCLVTDVPGQTSKIVKTNYKEEYEQAFSHAKVLFTAQTDASGNFNFQFPNIEPAEKDPASGTYEVSSGKLNRNMSWTSWESDPEKNFRIVYEPKQVKVKRVLRLVVDDPSGIFMSPDENLNIPPLETVDIGTLTSNVLSYRVKGAVGWDKPNPNFVPGSTDPNGSPVMNLPVFTNIQGVECYVLRKKSDVNTYQLPSDEGQNIVGDLEELSAFKIISITKSGTDGGFVFDNLLFRNCQAPAYFYFKTTEMDGDANFKPLIANQNMINPFAKPVFLFNADYNYSTITGFSSKMEPRSPTLKGQVTSNVSAGKGVKYATVKLMFTFKNSIKENATITDSAGYFDFTPLFIKYENLGLMKDLVSIRFEAKKSGFHYVEAGVKKESYVVIYPKSDFEQGKQKIVRPILYGNGAIKGRIINEQGNPVDAYVQFLENSKNTAVGGSGTMELTNTTSSILFNLFVQGTFEIPAIPGDNRQLVVIPKDVTYFADTITLKVNDNAVTNVGDIKVYERSHRIAFEVRELAALMNLQANLPVKGAKVELIGSPTPIIVYSDVNGKVNLNFKNVSESNLSVKVSGPAGSNYVPKVMSFTNFESDQIVQLPTVFLERGLSVKGKVMLDGKPTSDAEVYVELSAWQTGPEMDATSQGQTALTTSQHLFKAYPKADGTFEISTIPPELKGKQIVLKAVYKKMVPFSGKTSTTTTTVGHGTVGSVPTIVGEEKTVTVPNASGNIVLNLKTFDAMHITNVLGFPLEITKIQPQTSGNKVYVTGRVKLDGYCPGFDALEPLTLEVHNVVFAPSAQMLNGKPVGIPDQENVIVSLKRDLKLKYAKAFNVKLNAPGNSLFTIVKDPSNEGKGKLNATVAIVDNSFQYPSSYLNFDGVNFNFCTKSQLNNLALLNPVIPVFESAKKGSGETVVPFNLCNLDGQTARNLKFKFINFDTEAKAVNSTIEGTTITLDATLMAKVKDAGDVEVKIPKLVLKNNSIASVSGDTPIQVKLKDGGIYNADKAWIFEAKNWVIDPKVGGVLSTNCVLHTGSIDIPFKYFNLRSDFVYISEPEAAEINLGGYPITFTKLNQTGGAKVAVGYNPSCGGDKKGHWQVIFYPPANGDVPARVYGLPNMNNAPLELETVSLLSNGENVFTIGTGAKKMRLYNAVDFKPQTVFALPDGFVLSGVADFHIPRVADQTGVRLIFQKSAGSVKNPKFDPINLDFEGKGNIKFITLLNDKQEFNPTARTFTTYGTMQEPGVLAPVQVKMTYFDNNTKSMIRTEIVESPLATNQTVKIGEENTYLENVKCKTKANQTDWDLFVFEGDLAGAKGVSAGSNKHMVFTVHGEIKATQDGFKADGINTPFGGIQITYQKGRLIGTLNMVNVPLGSSTVNGVANLLMDSDGWAFYSNCKATNVPAPNPATVYMGILIGNYPKVLPEMSNTVLAYAVKKEMPSTFDKGLKGFFMVGGRELPIAGLDAGINVVVAKAYVRVPVAALDASFWGNYANGNLDLGVSLTGGLLIEFGLGSITCTELSGGASAIAFVTGEYLNSSLNLKGGADFTSTLTASQGVPYLAGCIDAVSISVSVSGGFSFNANPFKVDFYVNM